MAFYQRAFGAVVVHHVGDGDDIVAQLAVGDAEAINRPATDGHEASSMIRITPETAISWGLEDEPNSPNDKKRRRP